MRLVASIAALSILSVCGSKAVSADRGWHVGAAIGEARLDRNTDRMGASQVDFTATAWTVLAGYRFSKYLALEAGFTDYGDYAGTQLFAVPAFGDFVALGDIETSAKSVGMSAVGTVPLSQRFVVNGYLGFQHRSIETRRAPGFTSSDDDLAAQFGLGLGFAMTQRIEWSLDWMFTEQVDGRDASDAVATDEGETSMVSLGLRFRF